MFWNFTFHFDEYNLAFFGLSTVFGYFVQTVGDFFLNPLVTLVPFLSEKLSRGNFQ